jgi:hypothetical protein
MKEINLLNTQFYTVSTLVVLFFYGSGMVINYGSGFAKVRYSKKLRFLRFKFRNTGENILRYLCCSSEWRGSSQAVRITLNRRHSLPDQSNGD